MGLFAWLRRRKERDADKAEGPAAAPVRAELAPGVYADEWEELPAYIPVDPAEHVPAVVAASAIAAGERASSDLVLRRLLIANPEHRLVTCVASALAAGALNNSSFTVTRIYRHKPMEESHAA